MELDERALSWLAGLLEGEGCFSLEHTKRQYRTVKGETTEYIYYLARILVTSTDRDVLETIQSLVGGAIYENKANNKRYPNNKDSWRWSTTGGTEGVLELMEALYPYMHSRRQEKIAEIVNHFCPSKYLNDGVDENVVAIRSW